MLYVESGLQLPDFGFLGSLGLSDVFRWAGLWPESGKFLIYRKSSLVDLVVDLSAYGLIF